MKEFNLSEWLKDKSRKVVTRDGRPVRILCTDAKAKDGCCIIAAIETDGEEEGYQFYKDGRAYSSKSCIEDCADLFFADEEERLSEFKKALLAAFNCVAGKAVMTIGTASFQEDVDEWSKPLIDLARKEVKNNDWRQSLRSYKDTYEQGKRDALKDLPKWKKVPSHEKQTMYGMSEISDVYYNGYFIHLDDIYRVLPKEE